MTLFIGELGKMYFEADGFKVETGKRAVVANKGVVGMTG
jgi:hypothetical protein